MTLDRELTKLTGPFPSKLSISGMPLKLNVMIKHLFVLSLELCVYMYTESCVHSQTSNNNETHHQSISRFPIEEQIYTMPASYIMWGMWLLIRKIKHIVQAGKLSQWHVSYREKWFSVTKQHDLFKEYLDQYAFYRVGPTKKQPISLPLCLLMLHIFRGLF